MLDYPWHHFVVSEANPKIVALPVATIAVGAVQVGALFLALMEHTASGGPFLDRFLNGLIAITIVWLIVVLVDLLVFPTTRMTRLITGRSMITAAGATVVTAAVMVIVSFFSDPTNGIAHGIAQLGTTFVFLWAVISLWDLGRERWRRRRAHEEP